MKPKSTTINYNEQGQPESITTKHEIGQPSGAPAVETAPTPTANLPQFGIQPAPTTQPQPQDINQQFSSEITK